MADITITKDDELIVLHAQGETEAGVDFIDAFMPSSLNVHVIDMGRIMLYSDDMDEFCQAALNQGLSVEQELSN